MGGVSQQTCHPGCQRFRQCLFKGRRTSRSGKQSGLSITSQIFLSSIHINVLLHARWLKKSHILECAQRVITSQSTLKPARHINTDKLYAEDQSSSQLDDRGCTHHSIQLRCETHSHYIVSAYSLCRGLSSSWIRVMKQYLDYRVVAILLSKARDGILKSSICFSPFPCSLSQCLLIQTNEDSNNKPPISKSHRSHVSEKPEAHCPLNPYVAAEAYCRGEAFNYRHQQERVAVLPGSVKHVIMGRSLEYYSIPIIWPHPICDAFWDFRAVPLMS
jgi:hypothetical protein